MSTVITNTKSSHKAREGSFGIVYPVEQSLHTNNTDGKIYCFPVLFLLIVFTIY